MKFHQSLYIRSIKTIELYKFILLSMSAALLMGCSKPSSDDTQVDLGYSYFPVATGDTRIYRVDSLVYDNNMGFTTIDTFLYYYKEVVGNPFTDLAGKQNFLVRRYFRNHDTLPWVESNSSTILLNEIQAQRVDDNTRLVKLVFPLENGKTWNYNMFNAQGEQQAQVVSYDESLQLGSNTYTQALQVMQKNEINFIEEIVKFERYARNVGMVYLLSDSINTQVDGSRGYRYRLTLQSFTPHL